MESIYIYLSLHCHHQNDSCVKMSSDESHFNVSVGSDGQNHRDSPTNLKPFEEKGEPKRYRTQVLPLTIKAAMECITFRDSADPQNCSKISEQFSAHWKVAGCLIHPVWQTPNIGLRHPSFNHCRI